MEWTKAQLSSGSHQRPRKRIGRRRRRRFIAAMEKLESRTLLSGLPFHLVPHSQRPFTNFVLPAAGQSIAPPFTPAQIRKAYGLDNINFNGVTGNGAGQTIALIEAFNDPNLAADANKFSSMYNLPQFTIAGDGPTLTIENEYGSTSNLPPNSVPGVWDAEMSLDVEWAHAVAPEANILVIEGNAYSNNNNQQFIDNETVALNTAKNTPGVTTVSMSFGVPLTPSETATDPVFESPSGQQGIAFFGATGDSGAPQIYPADSPNVIGVGGTSLTINGDGTYGGETGWSGSGGGLSPIEPQPIWQSAAAIKLSSTQRATPDVAWLADPNTGVVVLDTYYFPATFPVGGTSLATPMWAALTSIADQGRKIAGLPSLDGASQLLPLLYNLPASDFNDITSGDNGHAAGIGYDLVTGLGSPNVAAIVSGLVSAKFVYVDSSAPGPVHDGSSWTTAYTSLQSVLASPPAVKQFVLVGQGTYLPGVNAASTFQLQDNQTIIGGFAGYGTTNPDASGAAFQTILSGNLGGGMHSAHVVTGSGANSTAILIGITISGGAGGAAGGGLYDSGGSPTLFDCNFTNNSATQGGADFEDAGSAASLTYCTFTQNVAANGGALYVGNASPTLTYCKFLTNSATGAGATGGGVFISAAASQSLINCVFDGNTAAAEGGGVVDFSSLGLIFGDAFAGNSAPLGGAISNEGSNSPIINCTFNANTAGTDGGAIYDGNSSSSAVTNCIFWMDSAPSGSEIFNNDAGSAPVVTYSDVQGGYAGNANINVDPLFVRAANPGASDYGDLDIQQFSPCVNVGDNNAIPAGIFTDAAGRPRIIADVVDLGAYESPLALIYVDASAPGPVHDGGSWATAYTDLQEGLSAAGPDFTLLVAGGHYSPGAAPTSTFQLIDGVSVEGGYAGFGAPDPNARDESAHPTILDGDGVDYHVVTASGTNSSAVLDDVNITGGNANGYSYSYGGNLLAVGGYGDGGGLYMVDGSPTISDCVISGDSAELNGGGVYSAGYSKGSSPTLINCIISGNTAYSGAGMYNGGLYAGAPTLVNCKLQNNSAQYYGGAFTVGGLLYGAPPMLINCTLEGDSAGLAGNAIHSGASAYGYAGNTVTLTNCIVYGDGPNEIDGNAVITYSDIQGGFAGQGNINVNPQFVNSTNLQLQATSPCINDGSNAALIAGDGLDLAGKARIVDSIVDMGAYEVQRVDVSWTGDGDGVQWGDAANWSGEMVPTQNDVVTIGQGFAHIQANGGAYSAYSLSSQSPVEIVTGSLTVSEQGVFSNTALTVDNGASFQIGDESSAVQVSFTGAIVDNGLVKVNPQTGNNAGAAFSANVSGNGGVAMDGQGTAFFQGNNTYHGDTDISTGALFVQTTSSLPTGGTVFNAGQLIIGCGSKAVPVITGNISGPGGLSVGLPGTAGFLQLASNSRTTTVDSLVINAGSTLDIRNNAVQVNFGAPANDPVSALTADLQNAFNGGQWNGVSPSGRVITSSTAQTPGSPALAVGINDGNKDSGAASRNQIVFKYTMMGDTNLDGLVNFGDLVAVVQNFNKAGTDWAHGNFLFGASTNFGDLVAVVQNFNKTLSPATSGSVGPLGGTTQPLAQTAVVQTPAKPAPVVSANNYLTNPSPATPVGANNPDGDTLDSDAASILTN